MESHVSPVARLWLWCLGGLVLVYLVLPTLVVIPMSFSSASSLAFPPPGWSLRWYEAFLSSPQWRQATWVSTQAAFWTMLLATPVGTLAAYGLHVGRFRLGPAIWGALVMPLMVPVILIAIGVFFLYARLGLLNTIPGLVLANTVLAVPFVLVTVAAGLQSYDMNQEMVARSLGASRPRAFLTVTLPQIRYSVLAGALLAFIVAFDEVVIALFISGGDTTTLTKRMFSSLRDEIDPTISAISTLLIVLATVPPVVLQLLANRRRREG